jgi:hypothetical protein
MQHKGFGKQDWVALFREIGLDDATMQRWHARFEARSPEAHESFLDWLGIAPDEAAQIREKSSGPWART